MGRQVTIQRVDDIDGSTGDDVKLVVFSLDGVDMEIDLNDAHADRLRRIVGEYVRGGAYGARWAGGKRLRSRHAAYGADSDGAVVPLRKPAGDTNGQPRSRKPRRARPAEATAAQVREWAQGQGIDVAPRGRIPADVADKYQAAHAK